MRYHILIIITASVGILFFATFYKVSVTTAVEPATGPVPLPTITYNPAAKKKLPPGVGEYLSLCQKGGGANALLDEVKNPVCKAYLLPDVYDDTPHYPTLIAKYMEVAPTYCNYKADGQFRCLFRFGPQTCKKFVEAHNLEMSPFDSALPWTPKPKYLSPNFYQCFFCQNAPGDTCMSGAWTYLYGPQPAGYEAAFCDTQINGPYGNYPDQYAVCGGTESQAYQGMVFTISQKDMIKMINRNAPGHNGQLKSDLAGFCWPKPNTTKGCNGYDHPSKANTCQEPDNLTEATGMGNSAQIHHIVPRKDGSGCACGKNSMKNAAVISAGLNRYFSNKDLATLKNTCAMPEETEEQFVEGLDKYSVLNAIFYRLSRAPKYDIDILSKALLKTKSVVKKRVKRAQKTRRKR